MSTRYQMQSFNDYFSFVQNYLDEDKLTELTENKENDPLHHALQYCVSGGKMIRSKMVPLAFCALRPCAKQYELELANKMGWVVEIHQAFILLFDDIMDQSETRRGKPCWYRVSNRDQAACNDGLYLEHASYQLLHRFLENDRELYAEIIQLFLNITYRMTIGESLDMETGAKFNNFDTYTMEKYKYIAIHKTGVYFCYLPICVAMLLAGMSKKNENNSWALVEDVCMDIGYFAQVLDDYLDCFGNPEKTGKIGSDIQNGKCTWLFAKSMEICNKNECFGDEWSNLKAFYGKSDNICIENVKSIYGKLGILDEYNNFQNTTYDNIITKIETFPVELKGLGIVFQNVLDGLCDRKK